MHVYKIPMPGSTGGDADGSGEGSGGGDQENMEPQLLSQAEMFGRWTVNAYMSSHDGESVVLQDVDSVTVVNDGKATRVELSQNGIIPREWMWHPTSEVVAFWAPITEEHPFKRIGLLNPKKVTGDQPWWTFYEAPPGFVPFGLEWSPKGDALYIIEQTSEDDVLYTLIKRVEYGGGRRKGKVSEIVRHQGVIDFFMPPVSRFENGAGPSEEDYMIVYGTDDGLFVVGPKGEDLKRLAHIPAVGLQNIEWNPLPTRNQVVLYFDKPVRDEEGNVLLGVVLADLDKLAAITDPKDTRKREYLTPLHHAREIHTLWFSPQGTYVCWSTMDACWFATVEQAELGVQDEKAEVTELFVEDDEGNVLPIKGVTWAPDETKIAFTAGTSLYVYDLKTKEQTLVTRFDLNGFAAEPKWQGNQLLVTMFEDISEEKEALRNNPPITPMPELMRKFKRTDDE